MVQPIDYSGGNGFLLGLQTADEYQQVQQRKAQAQQLQAQQAQAKQFQADWQASFGDPQKMTALAAKYPGQMDAIKSGIGFQDEQHQMALGTAARDLRIAMATGNPQTVHQAATKNAGVLSSVGSSPDEIMQQFQQDPQSLSHTVDAVGMSALGAKDYYGVENDRTKNQLTQRGQDLTAETARRGQDISASTAMRGQDMSASSSAADRQIRIMELKQNALAKQAANETNDLKRQQLQIQIDNSKQAIQDKQQQKQTSLGYASEAAELARDLSTDPGLDGITGSINSRTPTLRNSSQDVINKANRLQSLLTQDNLKMMTGVLTDRDIVFLGNIASGLNITENGIKGSTSSVQKRLSAIADKLDATLSSQGYAAGGKPSGNQKPANQQAGSQPPAGSGYSSMWGD